MKRTVEHRKLVPYLQSLYDAGSVVILRESGVSSIAER
jgi:hypothetical protein